MLSLLARLGGYTDTPTIRSSRDEIEDRLAERLGVTATPYDRDLLETRSRRLVDYFLPAARLGAGFVSPYPRYTDAAGADVNIYSSYGGVPEDAWFDVSIDEAFVGEVRVSEILGGTPEVRVCLGSDVQPAVDLLDDDALFEAAVAFATALRARTA